MVSSHDHESAVLSEEPRRAIKGLPFEERPTEIPPDSPRVLDAMERAARFAEENGSSVE